MQQKWHHKVKYAFFDRFLNPPRQSYFLFGPRETGKSTWLKKQYPQALWIDLLNLEVLRFYLARPERIRDVVSALPEGAQIVINEVQKVPEILSEIHGLIEQHRGWQFILTGSSARKLKRAGVDLLAGRALMKQMPPFFAGELGDRFDLRRALEIGMVPLIILSTDPEEVLQAYAGLYLKEEVHAESLVRNIDDFARFLEVVSFSHANQINLSNIARECEISRKTIENYLQILQDLLLAFTLPVFTKRSQRSLSSHPKLYIFDAGVFRSLRPRGIIHSVINNCASGLRESSRGSAIANGCSINSIEIEGAALEGLVAQHLRAWVSAQVGGYTLSFWRTRSGLEVDFIVFGPDNFWTIEVKNSAKIHPQDLQGLKAFKKEFPECSPLIDLFQNSGSVNLRVLLSLFFYFFSRGLYTKLILPPRKKSKIDQIIPKIDEP